MHKELSDAELKHLFQQDVTQYVFVPGEVQPVDSPVTVFLGGQPGAGKTRAADRLTASYDGLVPIVGDELRVFHPDYSDLVHENPLKMPEVTAQASGRWIQMCVDYAVDNRVSSLIEGTWRNPRVVLDAAEVAVGAGRSTHAVVVAVPSVVSQMSTLGRFYSDRAMGSAARWTAQAAHDVAVGALRGSIDDIARDVAVGEFSVTDRSGEILFHGDRPGEQRARGAVQVWSSAFERDLSDAELGVLSQTARLVFEQTEGVSQESPEAVSRQWVQGVCSKYGLSVDAGSSESVSLRSASFTPSTVQSVGRDRVSCAVSAGSESSEKAAGIGD